MSEPLPSSPDIVSTIKELRKKVRDWHGMGCSVGLVPTMGALHEGHLSLVRQMQKQVDKTVVSIFVNPTQFAENEDFGSYPRTMESDLEKLSSLGTNLVYAPNADEMYGEGFSTTVSMKGPATAGLEDKFRPHFFNGVATVVSKLLIQCQCDKAIFGEKDFQQLAVIRCAARDLDIPVEILSGDTIREKDGLAMSSRNAYLSEDERQTAPFLHQLLQNIANEIRTVEDPKVTLKKSCKELKINGFNPDYCEARNSISLAKVKDFGSEPIRLLVAAWLGKTRLIDNIEV